METKISQLDRLLATFPENYEGVLIVATLENQANYYRQKLSNKDHYQIISYKELMEKGGINV